MDTENKVFNHRIQDFPSKYRRTAIVSGLESINKRALVGVKQTVNQPEIQTNSFVLPPVNKNLINLASEELKNDDNILAFLACVSCSFALAENEETFMRIPKNNSYTFYLRCGIMICSIASIF